MDLFILQLVLVVVTAAIGLTVTVMWNTAYHGIRIYLLFRDQRDKKKKRKRTDPLKIVVVTLYNATRH